ncbi:serine hydrolase [Pacificimonas sp. WHA3]|uniref:Serine hydrolase n=1 Tax=Pacificimonas pallii TaxID=2827236 RepID=A0ABS6SAC6_9SPHN|nr:serine hydrolase [Pacificimonas pallii]MBV7255274.1 serine hydrolase [Pacificimonas pallii]
MKKLMIASGVLAIIVAVLVWVFYRDYERIRMAATLFTGAEQVDNFHRVREFYPVGVMAPAKDPYVFSEGEKIQLPKGFKYGDDILNTEEFLAVTDTAALLVVHDGKIAYENYWRTGGKDVHWISMSVAKSFISTLVGIAVAEGDIRSIEEPVTNYLPWLADSAFDGVRIKDILQMSSGAAWTETYGDPDSDVNRFGRIMAWGGSFDEFLTKISREREPGTVNRYNSSETQVLGSLLVAATGRSVTDYMEEKLWQPLGAENEGFWMLDDDGMEMAFGGLNATAHDYAKLGELFRKGGTWRGKQIVPADWVSASVTPDAPHLLPTDHPYSMGYGYQWWLMKGDEGEYSAIGVYNQFVYVNPSRDLVIVKLSANSEYGTNADGTANKESHTIEFFRAIGEKFAARPEE